MYQNYRFTRKDSEQNITKLTIERMSVFQRIDIHILEKNCPVL